MAEAAGAVEARHAVELQLVLQPEDAGALVERRRVQRAGRAEHRDLRHAEAGGDVHQARVVADQAARRGDQRHRLEQRRLAGEDAAGAGRVGGDLFAERALAGEPSRTTGAPSAACSERASAA